MSAQADFDDFHLAEPAPKPSAKERKSAQQKGRQKSGEAGERIVTAALAACAKRRLGTLRKRPTAFVVVENREWTPGGKKPKWFRKYTGEAGADFSGHLRGGIACYLEVKHVTDSERLRFSALRESQHDELDEAIADGAVAAVVVVWGPRDAYLSVIPWDEAQRAMKGVETGGFALAKWFIGPGVPLLGAYEIERQRLAAVERIAKGGAR